MIPIKTKRIFPFIFLSLITISSYSQEFKKDNRSQLLKEDGNNKYNSTKINNLDILQALAFSGIKIHKFQLGEFKKEYKIHLILDEYSKGNLVKSDTMVSFSNKYHYFPDDIVQDDNTYYKDYLNQIKIFTKTTNNTSVLEIQTYAMGTYKEIALNRLDPQAMFIWRDYEDSQWKLNHKTPIMLFASSSFDGNVHRFCGRVKLMEDEKETNELLSNSPNYFIISYSVAKKLKPTKYIISD